MSRAGVRVHEHGHWQPDLFAEQAHGVIIDACLGTGLKGQVRDGMANLLRAMNACPMPILAVDVPSGICADTGKILGVAVQATRTITFQASKTGHWLYPGSQYVGRLVVADIGLPARALSEFRHRTLLNDDDLALAFEKRSDDTHKGTFGHVIVLGGREGASGAVMMAADGAMAAGTDHNWDRAQSVPVSRDAYEVMVATLVEQGLVFPRGNSMQVIDLILGHAGQRWSDGG